MSVAGMNPNAQALHETKLYIQRNCIFPMQMCCIFASHKNPTHPWKFGICSKGLLEFCWNIGAVYSIHLVHGAACVCVCISLNTLNLLNMVVWTYMQYAVLHCIRVCILGLTFNSRMYMYMYIYIYKYVFHYTCIFIYLYIYIYIYIIYPTYCLLDSRV